MGFQWDQNKNAANRSKHDIDFLDAARIFDGPIIRLPARSDVEDRFQAIGEVEGRVISVIYTLRGDDYRMISARRASRNERKTYRALFKHKGNTSGKD